MKNKKERMTQWGVVIAALLVIGALSAAADLLLKPNSVESDAELKGESLNITGINQTHVGNVILVEEGDCGGFKFKENGPPILSCV